jgi:hypothetical protein
MKKIILAAALMMITASAMACETAGGRYDQELSAEYDQVRRQYDAALAGAFKSIEDGSKAAAETRAARHSPLRPLGMTHLKNNEAPAIDRGCVADASVNLLIVAPAVARSDFLRIFWIMVCA